MEYRFTCTYDLRALTAMNRAMRKTVRKKRSCRTHIFGWIVFAVGAALAAGDIVGDNFSARTVFMLFWCVLLVTVLIFEDALNARISRRRMLSGIEKTEVVFTPDGFTSRSEAGMSEWKYSRIRAVAETEDYFVFALDENYGQIYDKSTLTGGTAEEFATFIAEKTGTDIQKIR